jgi:hypothetical protein
MGSLCSISGPCLFQPFKLSLSKGIGLGKQSSYLQHPYLISSTEIIFTLEGSLIFPFTEIRVACLGDHGYVANLLALVKRCNNLNGLRLCNLLSSSEDSWTCKELTFASLREFHIDWRSPVFLQRLITACPFPTFPNITHLTIYDIHYPLWSGSHHDAQPL